jgi:site-specific DNA-adenine methylase
MNVQIENQDWYDCIKDYDQPEAVFYCDPPYVDVYKGTFKHEMTTDDHRHFLETVFRCQGFVAVSGYSNPLYDNNPWDNVYSWESFVSMSPRAFTDSNSKRNIKDTDKRTHAKEILWIKESQ